MVTDPKSLTYLLGGNWYGKYGLAPGPGHSPADRSLKISEKDGRIVFHSFAGDDWRDIRDSFRAQGLLQDDWNYQAQDYHEPQHIRSEGHPMNKKAEFAIKVWLEGQSVDGTIAETYLRSRGLEGPLPATLRFHPGLKHSPTDQTLPAMIASVQVHSIEDEGPVAIHRTFLASDGIGKADVKPSKMMLGPCHGGAVRLEPTTRKAKQLVLAEGIETALTIFDVTQLPTWACLSTSGLLTVQLPRTFKDIIIAADNDDAGIDAAREAGLRLMELGHSVSVATPEELGTDFNDLLRNKDSE